MRRTGENEPVDTAFGPAKAQKERRSAGPIEPTPRRTSMRDAGRMYEFDRSVTRFAEKATMPDEKPKKQASILGYDIEVPPPKKKTSIIPEPLRSIIEPDPDRRKEHSIVTNFD